MADNEENLNGNPEVDIPDLKKDKEKKRGGVAGPTGVESGGGVIANAGGAGVRGVSSAAASAAKGAASSAVSAAARGGAQAVARIGTQAAARIGSQAAGSGFRGILRAFSQNVFGSLIGKAVAVVAGMAVLGAGAMVVSRMRAPQGPAQKAFNLGPVDRMVSGPRVDQRGLSYASRANQGGEVKFVQPQKPAPAPGAQPAEAPPAAEQAPAGPVEGGQQQEQGREGIAGFGNANQSEAPTFQSPKLEGSKLSTSLGGEFKGIDMGSAPGAWQVGKGFQSLSAMKTKNNFGRPKGGGRRVDAVASKTDHYIKSRNNKTIGKGKAFSQALYMGSKNQGIKGASTTLDLKDKGNQQFDNVAEVAAEQKGDDKVAADTSPDSTPPPGGALGGAAGGCTSLACAQNASQIATQASASAKTSAIVIAALLGAIVLVVGIFLPLSIAFGTLTLCSGGVGYYPWGVVCAIIAFALLATVLSQLINMENQCKILKDQPGFTEVYKTVRTVTDTGWAAFGLVTAGTLLACFGGIYAVGLAIGAAIVSGIVAAGFGIAIGVQAANLKDTAQEDPKLTNDMGGG